MGDMASTSALAIASTAGPQASPTAEVLLTWETVADAMRWVGLDPAGETESHDMLLLDHVGFRPDSPLRELGLITKEDFETELNEWTVNDRKPPLSFRSKAKVMATLARVYMGLDYTPEQQLAWKDKEAADEREHQRMLERKAATPAPQPSATIAAAQTIVRRKVLCSLAVQERTDEADSFD